MKSIYWCIRRKIAEKDFDVVLMMYDAVKFVQTPLLLRLMGLEMLEVRFTNTDNPHNFNGKRLFIRKKQEKLHLHEKIATWRVYGDDLKKSPMVLWEKIDK